ncbi:Tyrosine recombinase XerC [Sulfitobacter sp. DSM 110093]|uniref:tyrosine-type recombinase/integrase n=1 Tax=Sulfitobacter sp. DSM 110093 TaxID=2883127 RepID=UPI001FAE366F|nr:tyrosine-type recombinase/integrase [Sulfitobacter sp. DSM 110093]UOA32206.1 Tyrosine recombinase XerC [Sulfitobacter sp. DSM 110093]
MRKPNLPYLEFKNVKGRYYIYFRLDRGGRVTRHRLPNDPDSEEFSKAYWEIRAGRRKTVHKTTWNNLVAEFYKTPGYISKAKGTRENYRRHCEAIREKNGDKNVVNFRRKDALAAQRAMQDTWSKANERIAVLSILCKLAVDLEWIERNPVIDIRKLTGGEYEPWPEDKLLAFEQYCELHKLTQARTIYELAIGTGQRIGDCIKMQWSDFDGEYISVVQDKTGSKLDIYCPTRLQKYLSNLPRNGRYIMAKNLTQSIGKRAAQKAVEGVREALGLMYGANRLVPHGWRYTAAVQLADAGCSDADIQAVTGHKTMEMVRKYRAGRDQRTASKRAQQRRDS